MVLHCALNTHGQLNIVSSSWLALPVCVFCLYARTYGDISCYWNCWWTATLSLQWLLYLELLCSCL